MAVDVSKIPNNNKFDPVREAILKLQQDVTDGVSGVATVNSSDGNITITNSGNITVGTVGETITIGIDDSTYLTSADLSDYLSLSETGLQTIAGDITISGDLTVSGTTTYINTTHLNIGDNIITLNADLPSGTAPSENAGIEINRGSSADVDFLWNETDDRWDLQARTGLRVYRGGIGSTTLTIEAGSTAGDAVIALTPNVTGIGGVIKTTNERPIVFQPNSTSKVVIASDGNMNVYEKLAVGKTTAASTYPLEVDGAVLASDFKAQMTAGAATYTGTVDQYFGDLQIRTDTGGTISLGGSGTGTVQNNVFIKDGDLDVNGDVTADNFIGDGSGLTAVNATTLDSLDSTAFLRSNTADTFTGGTLTISSTAPILDFVDTNSFTDANDRFRIRAAGDVGQIRWYDDSAATDTVLMSFYPDGKVAFKNDLYYEANSTYAIHLNNSDVIGCNAFYFLDNAEAGGEGLNFYRSSTTWDTLRASGGTLYFAPNRTSGSLDNGYAVIHAGNYTSYTDSKYLRADTDDTATGHYTFSQTATTIGGATVGNATIIIGSASDGIGIDNNEIHSTGAMYIGTNSSNLVLRPSDAVLINTTTTTGSAKLIVNGFLSAGSSAAVQIDGFIRVESQVFIHDPNDNTNAARLLYDDSNGLTFTTEGTGSNNFGIGTTSPSYKLDVSGDLRTTSTITAGGSITAAATGFIEVKADQTDSAAVRMGVSSGSNEAFLLADNTGAGHIAGNASIKMLVYSSGGALIEPARFTTDGIVANGSDPAQNAEITCYGNMSFGHPGNGNNVNGRFISIEGNTATDGEGSGRIFFAEHNSTTTSMDNYGMSIGYRGGNTSITGASGNAWTGLSQIGNGEWGMWGHDNNATGNLIMHGDRAATYVDFSGNNIQGANNITYSGTITSPSTQTRDKIRVWSGAPYSIGMMNSYTYGFLNNDYAMSFQMNNDNDRGFWWGDDGHSNAQGAMSLTTQGKLVVATSLSVGRGESVTSPGGDTLDVVGTAVVNNSYVKTIENTRNIDSENLFNINDDTTVNELIEQFGGISGGSASYLSKVDDNTAPAVGCFELNGPVYFDSQGDYIKVDQNSDYTWEMWVKYVSGSDTDSRIYLGWTMYNSGKSSFGNVQRYWGVSGTQFDANSNNSGWYKISGTISGVGTGTGQFINNTEYAKTVLLLNYNGGSNIIRVCGFKLYRSEKRATELILQRKDHILVESATGEAGNPDGYLRLFNYSNSLQAQTQYGYGQFGPENASWCHIQTDRPSFYFNKEVIVDTGVIGSYDEDLVLVRANSTNDCIRVRSTNIGFILDGAEDMRLENDGDLHVESDVIAYSSTISDARLKDDVLTIDNALDKVKALRGVEYVWNKGGRQGQKDLGFIAQEVEEVIPEIVREKKMPLLDDTGKEYKTVDYEKVVAVLVEAMKEQQKQIDELKARLDGSTK